LKFFVELFRSGNQEIVVEKTYESKGEMLAQPAFYLPLARSLKSALAAPTDTK
jgi:hypothetical protein